MKVLILGGSGMLGHKLWQVLRTDFDTWVTIRGSFREVQYYNIFDRQRLLEGVNALDFDTVIKAVASVQPDIAINCIGIVKQVPMVKDPITTLTVNALFPHKLANLCREARSRLIHISTDCVFSGRKGMYSENDVADAEDFYGRSKLLGEVEGPGCLTLRTSIIGRELKTTNGLVEWFLANKGSRVRGYNRAIYSGFTTLAIAKIISDIIKQHTELSGIYHVSSDPISKYDLLGLLRDAYRVQIEIEPYPEVCIDRSLDSRRFRAMTNFIPPTWPEMIQEMAKDPTPYDEWRILWSLKGNVS